MVNVNWITTRGEGAWTSGADAASSSQNSQGLGWGANSTSAWYDQLEFAAAGTVRSSIVVLACFNIVAAFATATGILWESWSISKKRDATFNIRSSWCKLIGSTEIMPFVLSCGIVVQGTIYAVAQSKGLDSLMISGCSSIPRIMLPIVFIAPFIQLAFGMDVAIRALRSFAVRRQWSTTICLVLVGLCLLSTLAVTFASQPPNFCFAGLFWYLEPYARGCFGLLVTIVVAMLLACSFIAFKLHKGAAIDSIERAEATCMVYYLVIAIISNTLLIPFFVNLISTESESSRPLTLELAMVAAVVANLSGLTTGGLYLFLRSGRASYTHCKDGDESDADGLEKGSWKLRSIPSRSSSLVPRPHRLVKQLRKTDSKEALLAKSQANQSRASSLSQSLNEEMPGPLRLGSTRLSDSLPPRPEPVRTASIATLKTFKRSLYSIFPKEEQPTPALTLPTTTHTPLNTKKALAESQSGGLLALPAVHMTGGPECQRGISMLSTATVQIGLRLSNVNDMQPSISAFLDDSNDSHDLGCPKSTVTFFPRKTSPLAIAVVDTPGKGTTFQVQENLGKDKELPPVPSSQEDNEQEGAETTLTSAVYSPRSQRTGHRSHTSKSSSVSSPGVHGWHGSQVRPTPKETWI